MWGLTRLILVVLAKTYFLEGVDRETPRDLRAGIHEHARPRQGRGPRQNVPTRLQVTNNHIVIFAGAQDFGDKILVMRFLVSGVTRRI